MKLIIKYLTDTERNNFVTKVWEHVAKQTFTGAQGPQNLEIHPFAACESNEEDATFEIFHLSVLLPISMAILPLCQIECTWDKKFEEAKIFGDQGWRYLDGMLLDI